MVASGLAERRRGLAVSAGDAPDPRLRDLRRGAVDRAAARASARRSRRRRAFARARSRCSVLVLLQIYLGALVAGLRAGLIYNTWPLIDGASCRMRPPAARHAGVAQPVREHADGAVQSPHDGLCAVAARAAARARCRAHAAPRARARTRSRLPALVLQAALGILTLLHQVPIGLALVHQAGAVIVLALAVFTRSGSCRAVTASRITTG